MKKRLIAWIVLLGFSLGLPWIAFAAGTCTESLIEYRNSNNMTVKFACTADASGVIDDTYTTTTTDAKLIGYYWITAVKVYPTPSGTAPTTANVTVKNATNRDLLGATGTNAVHATDEKTLVPYNATSDINVNEPIDSKLKLSIGNVGSGGQVTVEYKVTK